MLSMTVTAACTGGTVVSRTGSTLSTGTESEREAAALLELAMGSLSRTASIRLDIRFAGQGHHIRNTTYSAADRGWQDIRVDDLHAWVRVVGRRTFARGDRATLTGYFSLSDSTAKRLKNRWYVLLSGDPGFGEVTSGVKLPSLISKVRTLLPVEPLHAVKPTVRNGVRVTGVRGSVPDSPGGSESAATLWISADGRSLPVELDLDDFASKVHIAVDFDHWGDPVRVVAPTGAVRLATLPPLTVDS